MIVRLVLRHLALHPVRSLIFVGAYAAGVSVMLALLSIGEVMVEQSQDEAWVGGGDVTVVPAGVDLETLKTGGAVFFGIEQSRFIAREILGGPRLRESVAVVAPWLDDRAIYLRTEEMEDAVAVRGTGLIPSAARALDASPELLAGDWTDSEVDRRWLRPTPYELYREIDRFHLPPGRVSGDTTWAEWHYFNLLWPGSQRWLYLSFILGGDIAGDRWGGVVLARYRTPDGRHRSFSDSLGSAEISFSTEGPDVVFGPHSVRLSDEPARYRVRASLPAAVGGDALDIDIEVTPGQVRYFPPVELAASDSFVSGYVVPALRASARGSVCLGGDCLTADETLAYHDHNWGTWGGVIWDWGVAHAGPLDILYGGVHGPGADEARRRGIRFLGYVVDSLGVLAVLEPREMIYSEHRPLLFEGDTVSVPSRLEWTAAQGGDSVNAAVSLDRIALSRLTLGADRNVFFAQMQGTLRISGAIAGRPVDERGPGFFETYLTREEEAP